MIAVAWLKLKIWITTTQILTRLFYGGYPASFNRAAASMSNCPGVTASVIAPMSLTFAFDP